MSLSITEKGKQSQTICFFPLSQKSKTFSQLRSFSGLFRAYLEKESLFLGLVSDAIRGDFSGEAFFPATEPKKRRKKGESKKSVEINDFQGKSERRQRKTKPKRFIDILSSFVHSFILYFRLEPWCNMAYVGYFTIFLVLIFCSGNVKKRRLKGIKSICNLFFLWSVFLTPHPVHA